MSRDAHHTERRARGRLHVVVLAREARLRNERQTLHLRETEVEATRRRLDEDDALVARQIALWQARRTSWVGAGGSLLDAASLDRDRRMLCGMVDHLAGRRAALCAASERLAIDLAAWEKRCLAVRTVEQSLAERERASRTAMQNEAEDRAHDDAASHRAATSAMPGTGSASW